MLTDRSKRRGSHHAQSSPSQSVSCRGNARARLRIEAWNGSGHAVTGEYGEDGTLTGTRDGTGATWTTETDVVIKGTFENNKFTGTLEFPSYEGRPTRLSPLTLTK